MHHFFHLVTLSPWPLISGVFAGSFFISCAISFKTVNFYFLLFSFISISFAMLIWWRDALREGAYMGDHNLIVQEGLKYGMSLFIMSEVLFFMSWFWAFFHASSVPVFEMGQVWPPLTILPFDPFSVPLLNTAILLSSGVTVTLVHHNIQSNINWEFWMMMTITLGGLFTFFQAFEYVSSSFSISDSVFGTTFFLTTGFHGVHVIVGSLFLLICLFRSVSLHPNHHLGLEFSIWYWHFVDVVWLFLFCFVYWWSA